MWPRIEEKEPNSLLDISQSLSGIAVISKEIQVTMSHSVFTTLGSQWLVQLTTMRQSILDLKLDGQHGGIQGYGKHLVVDDEDLIGQQNTIWDLFSQREENEDSCGLGSQGPIRNQKENQQVNYDLKWLRNQCIAFTTRNTGLDAHILQNQLSALLASDQNGAIPLILHGLMEH